jgi:hypothetical protein
MLFLFRILTFPITGPVRGFQFILEQIRDQALAEMLSEQEIEALMIESSLRHQSGEISDEEYEEIETRLLEELRTLRQLQGPDEFVVDYYEVPEEDEVDDTR